MARHSPQVEPEVQVGRERHHAVGDGVAGQGCLGLGVRRIVGRAVNVQHVQNVVEVELPRHGGPETGLVLELGRDFTFHEVVRIAGGEPGQLVRLEGKHGVGQAAVTGLGRLVAQVRVDDVAELGTELADEVRQLHGCGWICGVRVAVAVARAVRAVLVVAVVGVNAADEGEQGGEGEECGQGGGEGLGHVISGQVVWLLVGNNEGISCANRSPKMAFCQWCG